MSERTKFIIRIAVFVIATLILGYGVYFIIFRPDISSGPTDPGVETPDGQGELPGSRDAGDRQTDGGDTDGGDQDPSLPIVSPVAQGGETLVTQLTQGSVLAPSRGTTSTGAMYYDPSDGYFYRIERNGELSQYSSASFPNAENVKFDPTLQNAVLEFPDGTNILYNFDNNRQITMPAHWESFDFSPNGGEVIAKAINDANNSALVVMSTDGSRAYPLQDMGGNADKVDVNWSPSGEFVAFSNTGPAQLGFGRRSMLLIDQSGEAPGSIIIDGTNFSSQWDPDGSHVLYSTSSYEAEDRPNLWYVKASGQDIGTGRKSLDVATWAEKCTFKDDNTLLCGVPREIEPWEGSSPLYNTSVDDLYEISVLTGRKTLLASPTITTRMFSPTLSDDGSTFYYTDQNGRLNYIRLR